MKRHPAAGIQVIVANAGHRLSRWPAHSTRNRVDSCVLETYRIDEENAAMPESTITPQELADLIRTTAESASAFIRGDIRHYLTLIKHADDYTLLAPFGGEPIHGFDGSDEHIEAMERYFQSGE